MTMAATSPGEKPASKTLVVFGFIAATLFTTVVGGGVTWFVGIQSAQHQSRLEDRIDQVNNFVEAAEAFDPLVVTFVREVRVGGVTPQTREAIKGNLVKQRGLLESTSGLLSADDEILVNQYIEALVAADTGLKAAKGPLDSRDFAQAAAEIAALRPDLIKALRRTN